jgi:glycosyltransferase involved in cell wall biosynthesis
MGNRTPRIFLLGRDGRGWSIDQDRKHTERLLQDAGFTITSNPFFATHFWCVWFDMLMRSSKRWVLIAKKLLRKKLIAAVTNDITMNPEKIPFLKNHIDVCIAPSKRVEHFLKQHGLQTVRIPFYVDTTIFHPLNQSREALAIELGIDPVRLRGKLIISSFQRDSLGEDLLKQKWQKNPELLVQICKRLPADRILMLIAGPRRHYLIRRCKEEGISYLFHGDESFVKNHEDDYPMNTLNSKTINQLLNLTDVYIVSSKSEGGPKAILEAALAGTGIISTDVGLAPDILHPNLIFDVEDPSQAAQMIQKLLNDKSVFAEQIDHNRKTALAELDADRLREKYRKALSL